MRTIDKNTPGAHGTGEGDAGGMITCCVSDASGLIVSGGFDKKVIVWQCVRHTNPSLGEAQLGMGEASNLIQTTTAALSQHTLTLSF